MKIVVIGGSGLIGRQVVANLRNLGHEAVVASPSKGVNAVTGEGLSEALSGADVVVDVSNSPSFEVNDVMEFFTISTRNLLAAEEKAGVGQHVALSIVKTDELPKNGYFRAKVAQEELIKSAKIPYTIVRATQFMDFIGSIAYVATEGDTVRVPDSLFQPIASQDVAAEISKAAIATALNGTRNIAGPDRMRFEETVRRYLQATNDNRKVVADAKALYFGSELEELSLVPTDGKALLTPTSFEDWLSKQQ